MNIEDINGKSATWERLKTDDKKNKKINGMKVFNSKVALEFLHDLEEGKNIGSQKGRRSPSTLTKHRSNLIFFDKHIKKNFDKITKDDIHELFNKMMDGKLKKEDGSKYIGTGEFMKNFKVFWKWMRRNNYVKQDITEDLSRAEGNGIGRKPAWVFLGQANMKKLIDASRGDYRALILFLYDSGIRPSELYRLRVYDLREDFTELHIPELRENGERVSKTFERTIKLKQSSGMIKQYIQDMGLKGNDYLVKVGQAGFNKYLRTLAKNLFGTNPTKARQSPNKLRMYDIRHNSAIFWLERYQRNVDLMYRFGWKREDKVFYYSEFIGKRDQISDDDMFTKEDKTRMEKELESQGEQLNRTNKFIEVMLKMQGWTSEEIKDFDAEETLKNMG
jgi:site-specific recombinase XerD